MRAIRTSPIFRSSAAPVKRLFKGVDQDIEWATVGDQIVLLQVRPYVERALPR